MYKDLQAHKVGARSIQLARARLNQAFKYAVVCGYLVRNVVEYAKAPKHTPAKYRTWTLPEARQFLSTAREDAWWPLWRLALVTGAREGELLGLRWKDVDWKEKKVRIEQQVQMLKGHVEIKPATKTGLVHSVALDDTTLRELEKHKARQDRLQLRVDDWQDNGLVFSTGVGTPISPRNFYRQFLRLVEKSGVPRIRPHAMRKTINTVMMGLGVHPKIASLRTGHADVGITMDSYTADDVRLQRDAAEAIGNAFEDADASETAMGQEVNDNQAEG